MIGWADAAILTHTDALIFGLFSTLQGLYRIGTRNPVENQFHKSIVMCAQNDIDIDGVGFQYSTQYRHAQCWRGPVLGETLVTFGIISRNVFHCAL